MSDSKSLITSWFEVMISSNNEGVFIHDLSGLTLEIMFTGWWASMNDGSKQPYASNISRHAQSSRFYLHSGIVATGSPAFISIVCRDVLPHPFEHRTTSMGKHFFGKDQMWKLNELRETEVTELTSTTVYETAFAILKMQGYQVITMVSLQRKIRFAIQFDPY